MTKLIYDDGKFLLTGVPIDKQKIDGWLFNHAKNCFQTNSLKEAARYKRFAEGSVKRLFQKLTLTTKPFPSGGFDVAEGMTLLPFQNDLGVPHILTRNRSYLAHQPGLGKSAQFITATNTTDQQVLVICPSFLSITWAREITKWSAEHFPSIQIIPNTAKQADVNWNSRFIICSHSMLLRPWVRENILKRKFKFIGIDEAHAFKNHEAERSIALYGGRSHKIRSPGLIYNSEHVVALSGTPMLNRPVELWTTLYSMAAEEIDYMNFQDFAFHYCAPRQNEYGKWLYTGSANEAELHQRITKRFMQRIRKDEVLHDLPDKVRQVVYISTEVRTPEIKLLDKSLITKIDSKVETLGEFAKLRHMIGLAKTDWVVKYVKTYLQQTDEQIILFAHHIDVIQKLCEGLKEFSPVVIQGGVSNEKRTYIEDQFQSGKKRLIVGNISAMNLGITLTAASRVLFAEYDIVPSQNEQAEDRAHRIGKKDCVFVQYLVCPNSLDELFLDRILKKETLINKVIEGK